MNQRNYLNLSLRSFFHIFVSGSLFFFFQNKFHISLPLGILGAFLTGLINEIFEDIRRIENSFHTKEVFKRDRMLAAMSFFATTIIVKLHLLFAALAAPVSLILLTSYIDRKKEIKKGPRNLTKAIADIASLTAGPLVAVVLIEIIQR